MFVKKYASCFFGTDLVPRLLAQPGRYPHHYRLHYERLCARNRSRCLPERIPPNGARGRRRSVHRGACTEPLQLNMLMSCRSVGYNSAADRVADTLIESRLPRLERGPPDG
jgi:hypothetical protein